MSWVWQPLLPASAELLSAPAGAIAGTAAVSLSGSATAAGAGTLAGTASIALTPSATASGTGAIGGTATLTLRLDTPWLPTHASTPPYGWWEADDLRNTYAAGNFLTLFDRSGNGRTAVALGTPGRSTSAINGLTAAATDGVSADGFTVSGGGGGTGAVFRNKAAGTLVSVYDLTDQVTPAAVYLIFASTSTSSSTRFSLVAGNGTTANAPGLRSKRLDADSTVTLNSTTAHAAPTLTIGQMDWANNDAWVYVDGALEASSTSHGSAGNTEDTAGSNIRLSRTGSSNNDTMPGLVGLWLVFDVLVDTTDRQKIEGYAGHKWGIALPGGHPYENAPPLFAAPTLQANGALAGAAALSLSPAGTVVGAGALAGTTTLALAPAATLAGAAALAGSTVVTLAAEGTLDGAAAPDDLEGSTALTLSLSASAAGTAACEGSTAAVVALSATVTAFGALSGSAGLALAASSTATGAAALVGTTAATLSPSATLIGAAAAAGSTALAFVGTAFVAGVNPISGSTGLTLVPSATVGGRAGLQATVAVVFSTSVTANLAGALAGSTPLAVTAVAELLGRAALAGLADQVFSATASLQTFATPEFPFDTVPVVWRRDLVEGAIAPREALGQAVYPRAVPTATYARAATDSSIAPLVDTPTAIAVREDDFA